MSDLIKPFFAYMGNKSSIAEWIIPYFPQHKTYIEVFGGTFSIGMNKPKSQVEFYNDINRHLTNLFEVVRSMPDEFFAELEKLPVSEALYKHFYDNHNDYEVFPNVENAIRYFYIMTFAHMGKYNGGFMYKDSPSFGLTLERKKSIILDIHKRVKNVIIINKDYKAILKQFQKKKDVLLYLDPPYVDTEFYYQKLAGAFTLQDHVELRDALSKFEGKFYLSYEDDDMIRDLYNDSSKYFFLSKRKFRPGQNSDEAGKGSYKTEIVVTNYKPQNTLFSVEGFDNE